MKSKQTSIENPQLVVVEHEGREISFEIRGPSAEEEEHLLNAVVDFLLEIQQRKSESLPLDSAMCGETKPNRCPAYP